MDAVHRKTRGPMYAAQPNMSVAQLLLFQNWTVSPAGLMVSALLLFRAYVVGG